jgi:hypothetical protein
MLKAVKVGAYGDSKVLELGIYRNLRLCSAFPKIRLEVDFICVLSY